MKKYKIAILSLLLVSGVYADEFGEVYLEDSKIVSSTGFETSIKNVASNPIVVTSEEIQQKNYESVDQILNSIPGVNIINQGGDKIIDLRGQGEKAKTNVQVLVDGIQINSLDTSMTATPINTLDVNTIERIEVIPGGGAVLYGSGTAGGVVNIITKSGQGFRGNIGYRNSEYDSHKYTTSIGQSFGKFDVSLDYTKDDSKGYRDYDENNSDFFQGKVSYKKSDTENITLKYSKFDSDETYPGMLTKEQVNEDRKDWGRSKGEYSKTDTDKDEVVLTYNNKINNNLEFNMSAFHQKTTMDLGSKAIMFGPFNTQMDSTFEDKKYGVKPKLKYSYGNNSSAVIGIDYIKNTLKRDQHTKGLVPKMIIVPGKPPIMGAQKIDTKTINDLDKETISGFVHNTYRYNNFEFIQGVRYERANYDVSRNSSSLSDGLSSISTSKNEDNYAIELATNYLYSDTGNTYIKYERGFTSPAPALLTNKSIDKGYYSNNLKSETYDTFEIGVKDFLYNSYVSATGFYTITNDEITTDMDGGMPPDYIDNYNLDKTKRAGVELSATQWIGKLTLSQSYSYINTEIDEFKNKGVTYTDKKIANVPNNRFKFEAQYDFTKKISGNFETIYTGSSYLNNENKGGKQSGYIVTNIVGNYSFNNGLKIYAGINNLFNEKYYNDVDYNSDGTFSYDPASERNYYIGFNYSF